MPTKVVIGSRNIKLPRKMLVSYLDVLVRELKLNEEVSGVNYRTFGVWAGLSPSRAIDCKLASETLGLMRTRVVGNSNGATGKLAFWTLLVTPEQGLEIINKAASVDGYIRTALPVVKYVSDINSLPGHTVVSTTQLPEKVTLAKRDTEETRAIAGPEPANPFAELARMRKDEPGALIAAARQYQQRADAVKASLATLTKLGVVVDEGAVHFEADPVLDIVVDVLPSISRLESEVERWKNAYQDLKAKTADFDEMKRNYEALKRRRNQELTASIETPAALDS